MSSAAEKTVPLSRNRNYQLLWGSQALADFGVNASTIAFPLLTLSLTGSAGASGIVLATAAAARLIAGLPAGALADRWSRKKIIVMCAAVQAITAGTLVAALWAGRATVAHVVVMAALMGICAALFDPAEDASLPNLVPAEQLPSAVALKSARTFLGQLTGSAAGGLLFAVGRAVPFAAHALTHAVAFTGLLFLRMPPRDVEPGPARHLGREMGQGLRWVWGNRYIRVTMLSAILLNLFFSAFYVVVIVQSALRGVPSGQIGVMAAMLGAGGVVGALLAARLSQRLSPYRALVLVFWVVALLTPVAAVVHNGYLLGLLFFAMALLPPTANTVIISRQLLLTPDEMRGRLSGVLGLVAGLAATIGPVVGGTLAEALAGGPAVLVCAAGIAATAVVVTASPTLRGRHVDPLAAATDENQPQEQAAPH